MTEREKKILYLAVVRHDEYIKRQYKEMKGHMTLDECVDCWFAKNEREYANDLAQW